MHMLLWQLKGLSTALPPSLLTPSSKRSDGIKSIGLPPSLPPRQEGGLDGGEGGEAEGRISSCSSTLQHTTSRQAASLILSLVSQQLRRTGAGLSKMTMFWVGFEAQDLFFVPWYVVLQPPNLEGERTWYLQLLASCLGASITQLCINIMAELCRSSAQRNRNGNGNNNTELAKKVCPRLRYSVARSRNLEHNFFCQLCRC